MSSVRDCVLAPPGTANYFWEYLVNNVAQNRLPFILANDVTDYNELAKLYDRFVCIYTIPEVWMNSSATTPVRVVYVNTEQLTNPGRVANYEKYTSYPGVEEVWDYSAANISISGKGKLVPCVPTGQELQILKTLLAITPKTHDLAVVNPGWGAKRQTLIQNLQARGWSVLAVHGFGQSRDATIARARALLNWHAFDDLRVYEELRCERWRLAGMPVITESCVNASLPDTNLVVVDTDDADGVHKAMCYLFPKHDLC